MAVKKRKKKSTAHISIVVYGYVKDIIGTTLKDFSEFADKHGLDKPKKKDLYSYIILQKEIIQPDLFYNSLENKSGKGFPSTWSINGVSMEILQGHHKDLSQYALRNAMQPPSLRDVYNYIFSTLQFVTAPEFFNVKM